jgi:hypothetical protein
MSKLQQKQAAKEQAEAAAKLFVAKSPLVKLLKDDLKTEQRLDKIATEIYNNLVNILSECEPVFDDLFKKDALLELIEDIYQAYPAKVAIRKTMINNAYKLTVGAKVNGKWAKGIGFAAMLAAVKDCEDKTLQGIRDALVAAKPDDMRTKNNRGPQGPAVEKPESKPQTLPLDSGVDPASLSHAERLREALRYLSCCNELLKIADGDEDLIKQVLKLKEAFNAKLVKEQQAA